MLLQVSTFGVDLSNRTPDADAFFSSICQRLHLHHVRTSAICRAFPLYIPQLRASLLRVPGVCVERQWHGHLGRFK